jgi:hypothetical protein
VWPPPSIVMSFTAVPARQPVHVVVDTGPSLFVSGECGQAFSSAHTPRPQAWAVRAGSPPPVVRPPSYGRPVSSNGPALVGGRPAHDGGGGLPGVVAGERDRRRGDRTRAPRGPAAGRSPGPVPRRPRPDPGRDRDERPIRPSRDRNRWPPTPIGPAGPNTASAQISPSMLLRRPYGPLL